MRKRLVLTHEARARIDKRIATLIEREARADQVSESQIVRRALRHYFETKTKAAA
jgi:hypothetical protein